MYTLVGKEIKNGEFKGVKYTHCVFYASTPCDDNGLGIRTHQFKVKKDAIAFFNRLDIGDTFKVYYDRFGNVTEISLQE